MGRGARIAFPNGEGTSFSSSYDNCSPESQAVADSSCNNPCSVHLACIQVSRSRGSRNNYGEKGKGNSLSEFHIRTLRRKGKGNSPYQEAPQEREG